MKKILTLAALTVVGAANAQVQINEIFMNPPGTDNGFEFVELKGAANASLTGLSLVVIEGDGTAAGTIDAVVNYGTQALGSNGLFLHRDASTILTPGPEVGTSILVQDFNPDLENGSNTYLLVNGFTGALGGDLDTNNDGTLDSTPWASVVDAIALIENDGASNWAYADDAGFQNFGPFTGFNADVLFKTGDGTWIGSDVLGSGNGPFNFDATRINDINGAIVNPEQFFVGNTLTTFVTPGSTNPTAVPEPATLAILGLGAAALIRRRNKR